MKTPAVRTGQPHTSHLLGPPTDCITFRICGTERDGQLVRVAAAKCAIGASPRCTLRLEAAGVQPLHCLVLRGPRQTIVRRWSPDTRLNSATFTDAPLSAGDRIGIGPIELEVVDLPTPIQTSAEPDPASVGEDRPDDDTQPPLPAAREQLQQARGIGRHRVRSLIARLRELDRESRSQAEELAETRQQVAAQHQQCDRHQSELQSQRAEWEQAREHLNEEIESRRAELTELSEQLSQQRDELAADRRQLESDREALTRDHEQLDQQRRAAAETPESEPAQSDETDTRSVIAPDTAPPAEEIRFEQAAEEAPVSTADLLTRMGHQVPDDDDPASVDAMNQPPQDEPSERPATSEAPAEETPAGETGDDSIENYMERLLSRVRGDAPVPSPTTTHVHRDPETEAVTVREEAVHTEPPQPTPTEYVPARVAPEQSSNLAAMRELANQSARSAIGRHVRTRWRLAAVGKSAIAVIAASSGCYLWAKSPSAISLTFLGGAVAWLIATFWGLQSAVLVQQIRRANRSATPRPNGDRMSADAADSPAPPTTG